MAFGTREWSDHSFNFMSGCSNDCVYCYAKSMAIRFGTKTAENWKNEEFADLSRKSFAKKKGVIMVPTTHDITPGNLEKTVEVLKKLTDAGNEILIVSKPRLECIDRITDELRRHKDLVYFRFTIGSADSKVLKLWEPGAPSFEERVKALKLACAKGYRTSLSCEPLLDDFDPIYQRTAPYVKEIWVGKMNRSVERCGMNSAGSFPESEIKAILDRQTDDKILALYGKYKDNPKIRWKDSISEVLEKHGVHV